MNERVVNIKVGNVDGKSVLYWMSREQRVDYNFGLLTASEYAKEHGLTIVVAFCLVSEFLGAAPSTPEHSKESFFEKMEHLKEKFFHAAKEDDHHAKTKALRGMSALSFSSMSMLDRLEILNSKELTKKTLLDMAAKV